MRNTIRLGFATDLGKVGYITVPDAPETVPLGSTVSQAMNRIVSAGIVRMTAGRLIRPESARHNSTETITFNLG